MLMKFALNFMNIIIWEFIHIKLWFLDVLNFGKIWHFWRMIGIATAPFGLALLFMQFTFRLVFLFASSKKKTKTMFLKYEYFEHICSVIFHISTSTGFLIFGPGTQTKCRASSEARLHMFADFFAPRSLEIFPCRFTYWSRPTARDSSRFSTFTLS